MQNRQYTKQKQNRSLWCLLTFQVLSISILTKSKTLKRFWSKSRDNQFIPETCGDISIAIHNTVATSDLQYVRSLYSKRDYMRNNYVVVLKLKV
jgi:hypothetical protein